MPQPKDQPVDELRRILFVIRADIKADPELHNTWKPFEDYESALKQWCQAECNRAREEAELGWKIELPDLPWFQIRAFNEERAEWVSPIYDTKNLPAELQQLMKGRED